jgi:hypothetical protein
MFSVLTELTVRAYMWIRTLLCRNLAYTKFTLFLRKISGRLFLLTSALVPTYTKFTLFLRKISGRLFLLTSALVPTYTQFTLFLRNRSGRLFPLTSALLPTFPQEWGKLT